MSKERRVGGGPLACSFCGVAKKQSGLAAGPGVYICTGCVADARAQGLSEGTGVACSFCGRAGLSNWGTGSPGERRPRICGACLDRSDRVLAGDAP
jgi:hypothetical protein